ncbi:MAG: bifunctional methylenetetrahydrofolate dehydrogenase/methenyltetrahydrofolate cyclohydrolase FolD [SAR324 cluster bacterium]|nr:bifunctional methylenetetrahydrofolate dehydrogenase/methenyltetrahydrofolate cyclohydrolase FolD [SAR324 cluster bacterium]
MKFLSGKELARELESELQRQAASLASGGHLPTLAVIRVGDDPGSEIYVRTKLKSAQRVGITSLERHLPVTVSQQELEETVEAFNADPAIHGILCQLPLPAKIQMERIVERIDPLKDVDCFHPENVGLLAMGRPRFLPCTPAGILELLRRNEISVAGRHVVVLGRSNIVGRPLSILLSQKGVDATVTLCHSRTARLAEIAREADILVAAIGRPEWVGADMVKEGAVVVDVGVHRVEDSSKERGYRICGDVNQAEVAGRVSAMTPVPGGVGPMTVAMLVSNTLKAAFLQTQPRYE